jgi:4a-hydroxytetrahydrobiopterin dehydratase
MKLVDRRCRPGAPRLEAAAVEQGLAELPGWARVGDELQREFRFDGYGKTLAFVNAVAWIAEREDHHPDLFVGWGRCRVAFSTHDAGGITDNDLVCAAKVAALVD